MTTNTLVCPFLSDEPAFALGVEFGLLFSEMKTRRIIKGYFCRSNQEQILLLANRLGWSVRKLGLRRDVGKPWNKDWFWLVMSRKKHPQQELAGDAES